jgi:hypothetical protein
MKASERCDVLLLFFRYKTTTTREEFVKIEVVNYQALTEREGTPKYEYPPEMGQKLWITRRKGTPKYE